MRTSDDRTIRTVGRCHHRWSRNRTMGRVMSDTGTVTHGWRRRCRWPIAHTGTVVAAYTGTVVAAYTGTVVAAYAGTMVTAYARTLAATN